MDSIWVRILLVLLWIPVAAQVEAKSSDWTQYSSTHFTLYSDRKRGESLALLQQFERFRYAALYITGLNPDLTNDGPVTIFLFRRKQDYQAVQPDEQVAGYYRDGWLGPEMVVGAEARLRDVSLILFHEYAHYLIRAHSQLRYPLWYDEGFAELMAASQINRDHVVIGLTHPWRKDVLDRSGPLSISSILDTRISHGDDTSFYATAWLLMHYLQLGHLSGEPRYGDAIDSFLRATHNGAPAIAAFEAHFGVTLKTMQARLQAYSERRQWKGYRLSVPKYDTGIKKRPLDANEVAYLLGGLAYRAGQQPAALEFLKRIDASDSSVAPAFSLRAVIEGHLGRRELALHILGFALQRDHQHSVVLANAAHLNWDLSKEKTLTEAKRAEHLQQAEQYARKALTLDGNSIEAARFLAEVYRAQGKIDQAIAQLLQQYTMRASDVRLNLELGSLYVKAGQLERAVPYLEKVVQWDHSTKRRRKAEAMLKPITELKSALVDEIEEDYASPIRLAPRKQ